jgi:hypothetical protein
MRPTLRDTLDALRAITHGEPSLDAWGRAAQLLGRLQGEDLTVALEYATPALSRWPAPTRRLTTKQWRRVRRHGPPPSWPLVGAVELREATLDDLAALVALPRHDGLCALDLHLVAYTPVVEAAARLADGWLCDVIEELSLVQSRLGDDGLAALLRRPWPRLQRLDLEANQLTLPDGGPLRPDALPALRHLVLSGNVLAEGSLQALAARGLPALEELEIFGIGIRSRWIYEALPALLGAPGLPRLHSVALPVEKTLPAPLQRAWAQAQRRLPPWFSPAVEIQTLDIFQHFIDNGALRAVKTLILSGWALGEEALLELLRRLAQPEVLPALRCLEVSAATPAALSELLSAAWAGQLQALVLPRGAGAPLGDAGAEALAGAASLGALELLVLAEQGIGPGGAAALGQSAGLGRLRALDLSGNRLGVPALSALAGSPLGARLEILAVDVAAQGPGAAAALSGCAAARWRPLSFYGALSGWGERFQGLSIPGISRMGWVHHGQLGSLTVPPGEAAELVAWLAVIQPEGLIFGVNAWSPAAAAALSEAALVGLQALSLSGAEVRAEGLEALSGSPWARALAVLTLARAALGPREVAALLRWPRGELKRLELSGVSGLTQADLEALQGYFGEGVYINTYGVRLAAPPPAPPPAGVSTPATPSTVVEGGVGVDDA